jgi:hypothetical protein
MSAKKTISTRVDADLADRLERQAQAERRPIGSLIRNILADHVGARHDPHRVSVLRFDGERAAAAARRCNEVKAQKRQAAAQVSERMRATALKRWRKPKIEEITDH